MSVQRRNLALCIIFSLVTCGLYQLYWMYCLVEDVNAISERRGTSGGMVLLFSIITFGIYQLYWFYKSGEVLDHLRAELNEGHGHLALLYLLLAVFGFSIVSYVLMQSELNGYAE